MRRATTYRHPLAAAFAAMMIVIIGAAFGVRVASAQILPSFGGDRSGTSGFQFLKIPADPRGSALGESAVATATDATSLFWNPALAAQASGPSFAVSHAEYFADVRLEYLAFLVPLSRPSLTIGASVFVLNSGDMDVTTEFEPFGTGERFRFVDLAAGLTVSQALTDLFSYGVTAKYIRESTAGVETQSVLFDIGVFYRVGSTRAQMAVAIRNFGPDADPTGELPRVVIDDPPSRLETEFESITPPTTFLLGAAYSVFPVESPNQLLVSAQLSNPNDNAENWNVGLEYVWRNTLILRSGYRFGIDERTLPAVGAGVLFDELGPELRFDYGYDQLERLGVVHRVGMVVNL